MEYIIISGIDGSGKTTIINALKQRLENEGFKVQSVWMRFNHILCKPIHAFCRLIGLSKKYDTFQGKVWRHEFHKSPSFCSFYIFITWLDSWLGYLKQNLKIDKNTDYVICDRWTNDITIDLAVKSRREDIITSKWYRRFQSIQPENSMQFVINRDDAHVLACRIENRDDPDFELRNKLYRLIAAKSNITIVNNTGSVEESVSAIYNAIKHGSKESRVED